MHYHWGRVREAARPFFEKGLNLRGSGGLARKRSLWPLLSLLQFQFQPDRLRPRGPPAGESGLVVGPGNRRNRASLFRRRPKLASLTALRGEKNVFKKPSAAGPRR